MKIVYIVNRIDGPGGLERVLSIKASMLADKYNYDVNIITLNQDNQNLFYEFSSNITYHNIEVKGKHLKYIYNFRSSLKKVIKKIQPDIITVCDDGLKGFLTPLILGKPCPMVYERHVSKSIEIKGNLSIFKKVFIKLKFKLMDIGGSYYDKFIVLTKGNLNEWNLKNIMVIPNPLSFYPEDSSSLLNKKVLAVGKQSYQKGYDRLLKSWKLVINRFPDWELDIYGTINKSEGLDKMALDMGISNSVNFFEPVKNISEKYKETALYVMSSRYEGFGMVLTEAMAYGVPCVSFDCPYGPSDIITNQENGILVKNGDIDGLATGINTLIENEKTRILFGKKAKNDVKRYLPNEIVEQWDSLFKNLTKNYK